MDYYKKYLKYKNKYLELKYGGFRNCPPEAVRCENHPVVEGEIIDIAYDGWTYREQPLENRCGVCQTRFANEKICGCCHRICTNCRELLNPKLCPFCRERFNAIFELNNIKTNWIRLDLPSSPVNIMEDESDDSDDSDEDIIIIPPRPFDPSIPYQEPYGEEYPHSAYIPSGRDGW